MKKYESKIKYNIKDIDYHLFDAIDKFSHEHGIDYYMSGGCYEFAYTLILTLEYFNQKYQAWNMGEGIHMVVQFNNQFWDVSNSHRTLTDKEMDFYTASDEDRTWGKINKNYVRSFLHSTNIKNSKENAQELIDYIEGNL